MLTLPEHPVVNGLASEHSVTLPEHPVVKGLASEHEHSVGTTVSSSTVDNERIAATSAS